MRYTDLQNFEVKPGTYKIVDIDGNGTNDFLFETLLLGDALGQRMRLQFYAYSYKNAYQPVNELEQVPVLSRGDSVKVEHPGYTWYHVTAMVLAEKIMPTNGQPYWEGLWTAASHKFLSVHIEKGGQRFYGWIELSFDAAAEKIILHKAAICTEANREVKAGW